MTSYKDLIVWQKSMNLATEIYKLIKKLPKEEIYSLSDQMRRAAISIPSHIAEGHERMSTKEYLYFLAISRGSNAELETQLQICMNLGYLKESETEEALKFCEEIRKMLNSIIYKLRNKCND